ncbi:MAG TPA: EAL domain-containing protein [Geobacterales bacterium]|nr:EAL domain-containing protein [Geobacterales bacterium]
MHLPQNCSDIDHACSCSFHRAITASGTGIFFVETDQKSQRITYINPSFSQMTGYRAEDVLGHPIDLFNSDERDRGEFERLKWSLLQGVGGTFLLRTAHKSGSLFWNELSLSPLSSADLPRCHVGIMSNVNERKQFEEQLLYLYNHDPLTGLPNRNLMQDRLLQALAYEEFHKNPICVMHLDLDNFKLVNDTLGHATGDLLLKGVAQRLCSCIRGGDTVARSSGDEFSIILPLVRETRDVLIVAKKIIGIFADPFIIGNREIFATASIGITLFPHDGESVEVLLKNADTAMYHAKEQGKNSYQFFSEEMNSRVFERLAMETSLRHAMERQEFTLYYQPRFDCTSGCILGTEALIRWQHPDLGLLLPGRFINLTEETGLIIPIGQWVVEEACRQLHKWLTAGFPPLRVAVNISARQFCQGNLTQVVAEAIRQAQIPPQLLELELTESLLIQDAEGAIHTLHALKGLGVHLSLDDFGTGYSSLSYLKRFPLDTLKIDRSFVRDIPQSRGDSAIVSSIIDLARNLGLSVTAEGVENQDQLLFLRQQGCQEVQGFHLSRPLAVEVMTQLLAQATRS